MALQQYGAATSGCAGEEALQHIHEVVQIIIDELQEDGIPIPAAQKDEVETFSEDRVAVTV